MKSSGPSLPTSKRLGDALAVLFCFLVLCWLITLGDWDFFPPGGMLEEFYDAQAQSLLEGRIDVPPEAIGPEAFVHSGKSYGYFGPTPALLRLPLEVLMPAMHGHWSRTSMLAASLLAMLSVLLFFRRLEKHLGLEGHRKLRALLRATAIVSVALGSSNLFLCAESKVYQEAIIWGAALTLAQAVFLFCYLTEPRSRWLALACATAFLAFFARVSSGAGALLSLAIVDLVILLPFVRLREYWGVAKAAGRPAAIAMSATLLASAVCWAGLNYAKFGVLFVSQPMQMNVQYGQERLARIKGDLASLDNLPLTAACYLSPGNIRFGSEFPWVYLTGGEQGLEKRFPKAHFDRAEAFSSLPPSAPGLLLAALCGTLLCFAPRRAELRVCRAPLAGAFAGGLLLFMWGFISYRYLEDTLPWLAVGSVIALTQIPLLKSQRLRHAIVGLVLLLTAYGVWTNFAFAILQQRFYAYPIPQEKRLAFRDFADAVSADGLGAIPAFGTQWRKYVEAAAFVGGNVAVYRSTGRVDEPVIASEAVPARADYTVAVPSSGRYAVDVRCASGEPRPLQLLLNGRVAAVVCGFATGGFMQQQQQWFPGGVFPLPGGLNQLSLASEGPFPAVSMIRLTRVD
jgi:hypothetical protein